MSNIFRMLVSVLMVVLPLGESASAQVLPVLNTFSGRTFEGTVDVSWPVLFENCTFRTDGVILKHSYGAVFRNCRFEGNGGNIFIAESGDGIVLADCQVNGCDGLNMCREYNPANRNYITGVTLNGHDCTVLDEQETIIDIDGLDFEESVRGESDGPLFMIMNSDKSVLGNGEIAHLHVRGLEKGTFVGWSVSAKGLKLTVDDDGLGCRVYAADVRDVNSVVVSAYTEYGLEAAYEIKIR